MSKIGDFFKNLLQKAIGLFRKAEDVATDIFHAADNFVDIVKKLESSEAGQFIETGIEAAFPQFTGLINAIKLWFTNASAKLANVEGEVHTDEAKIQAFLDYLASLKVDSPTLYAGTLNTLNADLQQLLAGASNTSLTPQMSLVAGQVIHDENLGTVAA